MIKKSMRYFLTTMSLLATSFSLYAAAESWTLDPEHTSVLWKIEHLGFSTQVGKFYASGTLTVDEKNPKNSKVDAKVKVSDIVTGLPELNKHLLGHQFFDSDKFPIATFVSNKVDVINKNSGKIYGTLSIHGVSKPVTLDVTMNKTGQNPINNKMTMGFTATTVIKRSDFGMNTLLPALGDEIKLEISAEAHKNN